MKGNVSQQERSRWQRQGDFGERQETDLQLDLREDRKFILMDPEGLRVASYSTRRV